MGEVDGPCLHDREECERGRSLDISHVFPRMYLSQSPMMGLTRAVVVHGMICQNGSVFQLAVRTSQRQVRTSLVSIFDDILESKRGGIMLLT